MAMLAVLCAVRRRETLFCVHVNHSLRAAESRADAEFVVDFCKTQGIQCRVADIPPGKIARFARRMGTGMEAAARFFRRRAFFREAARLGENVFILTAHTRDDALETALMRVLRGSGPAGLAAMLVKKGRVLKPMLSMTRADVACYLETKNIPWREDSTNTDENILRNRIRRRLIPLLNESFPSWKAALSGMAETQSLAASFLAQEARCRVIWEDKNFPVSLSADEENFFAQPQIIREEAFFLGVDILLSGARNPGPVKRAVVRRFCAGDETAADLGPLTVRHKGGRIVLSVKRKGHYESGFSLLIKEPGLYNLKKISIEVRPFSAQNGEDTFTAALPLVFRRAFKDDFFIVRGKKKSGNFAKNLISAVDVSGTAAFIGPSGLTAARDCLQDGPELFSVKISSPAGGCDDRS